MGGHIAGLTLAIRLSSQALVIGKTFRSCMLFSMILSNPFIPYSPYSGWKVKQCDGRYHGTITHILVAEQEKQHPRVHSGSLFYKVMFLTSHRGSCFFP